MGIREDIRSALVSIIDAVHEASATMRHGDGEHGTVLQSSSREFADPISGDTPAEAARFVANADDFPTLDEGAAVEIGDTLRLVVSMKKDPVGATISLGVSAEFEKCPAAYSGRRREKGAVRVLDFPLDILLLESGTADNYAHAIAPTYAQAYTVAVRAEDWPEVSMPDPSDEIQVAPGGYPLLLKVSTATKHGGFYVLKCRTKD